MRIPMPIAEFPVQYPMSNADYPMLGGKGAEMRHLLPILRAIWCKYARAPMKYEQVVLQVLNRLCAFYEALEYKEDGSYPFHLPTAVSDKMLADVEACLQHWTFLARLSIDQGKNVWNVVPKHHYLWHPEPDKQTFFEANMSL